MRKEETHRALEYPAPAAMANIRIVLVEPLYAGNIGATARAMKTAGIFDLALVRPAASRDSDEARQFASGAHDVLEGARIVDTLDEAASDRNLLVGTTNRRRSGMLDNPIPMREAAKRIMAVAEKQRVGVLFGREDFGLSSADLARCHFGAAIPVAQGMPPLNLAQAVQVVSQELLLAGVDEVAPAPLKLARVSEVEALLRRFEELFDALGPDALTHRRDQVLDSLRRVFSRVGLEPRDVRTLHMIVRASTRALRRQS